MANSYPGIGNAPRSLPFDAATDPRKGFYIYDDFVSGGVTTGIIGVHDWVLTGTGATAAYSAVAGKVGVLTITGATTGFAAGLSLAPIAMLASTGLYMVCYFRTATALADLEIRVGFTDVAPTAAQPDNGVWLEYDNAADADDWRVGADDGTTDVDVVASSRIAAPAINTDYCVELVLTTNDAKVFLNGENVLDTLVTNVTTAALTPFVYTGDGAAGSAVAIDYIGVKSFLDRSGFTTQ